MRFTSTSLALILRQMLAGVAYLTYQKWASVHSELKYCKFHHYKLLYNRREDQTAYYSAIYYVHKIQVNVSVILIYVYCLICRPIDQRQSSYNLHFIVVSLF